MEAIIICFLWGRLEKLLNIRIQAFSITPQNKWILISLKKTQIYFPTFTVKYWCLWEIEMKSFILKALSLLWQWGTPSLLQAGRGWKGYSDHTDLALSSAAIFFFDWKKLLCPCVPNKVILPSKGGRRLIVGRYGKRAEWFSQFLVWHECGSQCLANHYSEWFGSLDYSPVGCLVHWFAF